MVAVSVTIIVRTAAQFRFPTSNESLDLVIQSLCPNDVRAFAIADTQKEHSRDADIAGLSDITLESLQHFRGQIQDSGSNIRQAMVQIIRYE